MSKYYLTNHTFFCLSDGCLVFLDLHNDKYRCLPPEQAVLFTSLFQGGKISAKKTDMQNIISRENSCKLASELIEQGLLTKDPEKGKEAISLVMVPPTIDLIGYDLGKKTIIRPSHIARFIKASFLSTARLRWRSVENIAGMVKQRKLYNQSKVQATGTEEVRELVEIFKILRPLVFTAKNHCLFDSLTLLEFLSYYNIFPSWVFGIKMGPFAAHCWIRQGSIILNDSVDHVTFFTPIMAI